MKELALALVCGVLGGFLLGLLQAMHASRPCLKERVEHVDAFMWHRIKASPVFVPAHDIVHCDLYGDPDESKLPFVGDVPPRVKELHR